MVAGPARGNCPQPAAGQRAARTRPGALAATGDQRTGQRVHCVPQPLSPALQIPPHPRQRQRKC